MGNEKKINVGEDHETQELEGTLPINPKSHFNYLS